MVVWLLLAIAESKKESKKADDLPGLRFLGHGYDLIKGNPDGDLQTGGTDPGIQFTYPLLNFTYEQG